MMLTRSFLHVYTKVTFVNVRGNVKVKGNVAVNKRTFLSIIIKFDNYLI